MVVVELHEDELCLVVFQCLYLLQLLGLSTTAITGFFTPVLFATAVQMVEMLLLMTSQVFTFVRLAGLSAITHRLFIALHLFQRKLAHTFTKGYTILVSVCLNGVSKSLQFLTMFFRSSETKPSAKSTTESSTEEPFERYSDL